MEDSTERLTDPAEDRYRRRARAEPTREQKHRGDARAPRVEFGDDECSTDSGCSSGGSTGSAERLSRRGSAERLCRTGRSPKSPCYLNRLRGRSARSLDRLSSGAIQRSSERVRAKSSRSWSPSSGDARTLVTHESSRPLESPSYSPSPTDAHSSSDSDSLKRSSSAADTLRRAFQTFKISSKWEAKEKKHAKKSPKRILRSPVSYTYVRGLSGLPTQRVPRNAAHHLATIPCSCQDAVGLYR